MEKCLILNCFNVINGIEIESSLAIIHGGSDPSTTLGSEPDLVNIASIYANDITGELWVKSTSGWVKFSTGLTPDSVDWSKITNTPTTIEGYGILGGDSLDLTTSLAVGPNVDLGTFTYQSGSPVDVTAGFRYVVDSAHGTSNHSCNTIETLVTGTATVVQTGSYNVASTPITNTSNITGSLYGSQSAAYHLGTGTVATAYGAINRAQTKGTGTISNIGGTYGYVENIAGAVSVANSSGGFVYPSRDIATMTKSYAYHTSEQMNQVAADGSAWKLSKLTRFNTLRTYVLSLSTRDAVVAVDWNTEIS